MRRDIFTLKETHGANSSGRMGTTGFNRGKLCLTNTTVSNDKRLPKLHFIDEGKTEMLKYILTFLKLYIKLSHHSLIDKLKKYGLARLLDELTIVQTAVLTE